ncbi:hypothetical protein AAFN47_20100 [Hoeflea sp. CAU 1731]
MQHISEPGKNIASKHEIALNISGEVLQEIHKSNFEDCVQIFEKLAFKRIVGNNAVNPNAKTGRVPRRQVQGEELGLQ